MNIALILKGNISRRQDFEGELQQLRASFPQARISVLESTYPGHSRALAEASCGHCDYMIAVGGDGTLNEVLNGCLESTAALPCFGVLAHGSANDMLRSLGLDGSVDELCALIREQCERTIDVGRVNCCDAGGDESARYFINIADLGIGAVVVQHLNQSHRLLGSNLHYLRAILKTFSHYRKRQISVQSDGDLDWQGKALALVAANGRYFGSGLCVAPGAALDDGLLSITLVGDARLTDFALNLRRLKRGAMLEHPEASYHHASRLDITAVGEEVPLEVDGEFLGFTPASIEILPRRVRFLGQPADGSAIQAC